MAAYTTIDNSELFFQCQLYTGNGSGGHAITFDGSENMQPDLVWIKQRDSRDHFLFNSVSGATKYVASNTTSDEETDTDTLTAFNSDGFTLGSGIGVNENTDTHVSWNWKESATAGFDIVSYTGNGSSRTISHSLSQVPDWILVKNRDFDPSGTSGTNWDVWHSSLTATSGNNLLLNTNAAEASDASKFNSAPTSSVFGVNTNNGVNKADDPFIAYLWCEKQGFSKFGSYVGTNSANPVVVNCGFKPAWIMIKERSGTGNWVMQDNKRIRDDLSDANNGNMIQLYANSAEGDDSDPYIYTTANGFVNINANSDTNASGATYVYMAFAESPFVNSKGVPNNAQ
tara:strand:+ start:19 stop:1044 length:1026 start_codon:yes stop_codon:yes gene_type:complete